ncbi:MAG: hypothetical protein ABGZ17_10650, partial [Planctomycetaceae bacterium]
MTTRTANGDRLAISSVVVFLILAATGHAQIQEAAVDAKPATVKPYGLQQRTPWTNTRLVGTPDPPPPYTVERVFSELKFDHPVFIAQEPGTDRILVAELSGKIRAFPLSHPQPDNVTLFLDTKRQMYAFSFH